MKTYKVDNVNDIMDIPSEHIDEFLKDLRIHHDIWHKNKLDPKCKSEITFTPDGKECVVIEDIRTGEIMTKEKI